MDLTMKRELEVHLANTKSIWELQVKIDYENFKITNYQGKKKKKPMNNTFMGFQMLKKH